jgi:hypothetical protein
MGTVTVTDNGAGTITVQVALVSPLEFVNTGLHETIDFNVVGTPTLDSFTTTNPNFALASTTAGSEHFDGFGSFEYAVSLTTGQGGGNAVPSPETFTFHCAGCTAASLATMGSSANAFFGVDVFSNNLNGGAGNGNTGPIGGGVPAGSPIPEPTTISLLGSILLFATNRLRKKTLA